MKVAYALGPLGYEVCRLAPGENDTAGKAWLPKPGPLPKRPDPAGLPKPVRIADEKLSPVPFPVAGWEPFVSGTPLCDLGVYDPFPVAYRAAVTLSAAEAENLSGLGVDFFADDRVVARVNGVTLATAKPGSKKSQNLDVRGLLKPGVNTVELLYEDPGSSNWDYSIENRYGVKAARLAVAPPVITVADWR